MSEEHLNPVNLIDNLIEELSSKGSTKGTPLSGGVVPQQVLVSNSGSEETQLNIVDQCLPTETKSSSNLPEPTGAANFGLLNRHCQKINGVSGKIQPIFVCQRVANTTTGKRDRTGEKYLATTELNPELIKLLQQGIPHTITGKVDGTCSVVLNDALYKRRDIKAGREIPGTWVPTGTDDTGAHLVGFMPLESGDRWHIDCHVKNTEKTYHMDKVNLLDLNENKTKLVYVEKKLSDLNGMSVEVMGPKFQGNPHHLKQQCVMRHGILEIKSFPDLARFVDEKTQETSPFRPCLALEAVKQWFAENEQAAFLEGIVLHFENGVMFKIHRNHLDLKWSVDEIKPLEEFRL